MTYPSKLIFKEAEVLDIRQHYFHRSVLRQYKQKSNLTFINHSYETRQKINKNLITKTSKKSIGQRNHIFLTNRFYNVLPSYIREAKTYHYFSKNVKSYLLYCDSNLVKQFF